VRATRAYLAGFGTSGSLLAGAALMFLLASAFVAFQGWPQVGGQSSPVLVSLPHVNAASASRASRVLSSTTAGHPSRAHAGAGGAASTRLRNGTTHLSLTHAHRGSDQTTGTPVSSDPGSVPGHPGTGPTPSPRPCTINCGPTPSSPQPLPAVHRVVSGTKQSANSTVSGTVSSVKKVLPGSSGSSAGGTVGHVVTTVKKVVGGGTGGLP
jgi:hypothetical protein